MCYLYILCSVAQLRVFIYSLFTHQRISIIIILHSLIFLLFL
nr:MAG TPA: hypothetical protein [Bacteriophage sp.]